MIPLHKAESGTECDYCEDPVQAAVICIGLEAYLCRDCTLNFIDSLKAFLAAER